jgi:hypothetical protein
MHMTRAWRTIGRAFLFLCCAAAADAKTYVAERFDCRVELLRGGSLRVVETVVFRFESGTFKEVFREIPSRNSDGVEFVHAAMDGAVLPEGDDPGQVEVRRSRRLRVKWRFGPTSGSTHVFELVYVIHGAVREAAGADLLVWPALPREHRYRIESSTIDIALPAEPVGPVTLPRRKVERASAVVEGPRVRIDATGVRSNGWLEARVTLPLGSAIGGAPAWQQRQRYQRQIAPRWAAAAGAVWLAALVLLFAVHQGYDPPRREATTAGSGPALPDTLEPAEAGALTANASPGLAHAMATLLRLADRGEIFITEEPKGRFGQRRFVLARRAAHRPVAPYEQAAMDIAFSHRGRVEETVPLDQARSRIHRHFKLFRREVRAELQANGLIDEGRKAVRDRYGRIAITLVLAGVVLALPLALITMERFGGWPLLLPLALGLAGLAAGIAQAGHTPLSNEGVRRAHAWRAFRRYLKEAANDRATGPADAPDRLLPYAVALGMADAWSKYLTRHRIAVPAWFHSAAGGDSSSAFVAFVAYSGASGDAGAGGGGAGGGASGAG